MHNFPSSLCDRDKSLITPYFPLPHTDIHTTGNQHNEVPLCLGTLGNIRTNTVFQHIIVHISEVESCKFPLSLIHIISS